MARRRHRNESPMGSRPSSSDMRPNASAHDRAEVAAYKSRHPGSQIGKRSGEKQARSKGPAQGRHKRAMRKPAHTGRSTYRRKVR